MFKIYDGRNKFYQWDIDRKLIIEDDSITQVHFCNKTFDNSLVCEVRSEGDLRVVDVPNLLLQEDWSINVYAYDEYYTKYSERFEVVKRSKPDSYVYTDTEILSYQTLLDRMDEVDANIASAVDTYLEENPVEVDLSGLATEEFVNDAIAAIEFPDADLTGYATEKYVDDKIAAIDIPEEPDLSGYALKSEIPDVSGLATKEEVAAIEIPDVSGFTTMSAVEAKGYQTSAQVSAAITSALGAIGVAEEGAY